MGEFSLEEALLFNPISGEGKELVYTDDIANLIVSIKKQQEAMNTQGFEAEYILMNRRNYERLIIYVNHHLKYSVNPHGLIDDLWGMKLVVWDVPIDYVNVRAKASTEFAYDDKTLRGKNT